MIIDKSSMQAQSGSPILSRPTFSSSQFLQAYYVGQVTQTHRATRPGVPTYTIDDKDPKIISDRDDGIFVEIKPLRNGYYPVHITIADVAGHVSLKSPLARAVIDRGFSVYGPGWTDPMFPKFLEEKLSLEHRQERLGFTVSIDVDTHFVPYYFEFGPVITHAESMSYEQAAKRMQTDPQLRYMAKIAQGLRHHFVEEDITLLQDVFTGLNPLVFSSSSWQSATEMVATYMILANTCMASFFYQSGLPYLYRNFIRNDEMTRAYYDTHFYGHDGLRYNIAPADAYGPFTCPLRRAADFFNQHMAHFASNVLLSVEQQIIRQYPDADLLALHRALWAKGPQLLKVCATASSQEKKRKDILDTKKILAELPLLVNEAIQYLSPLSVADVIQTIAQQKPPISIEELDHCARQLNALAHAPDLRDIARKKEIHEKITSLDTGSFTSSDKKAFSALLRKAANLREIPEPLYDEAIARIDSNHHDPVQDGFVILVLASHSDIPRWNKLKRAILRKIKHDPATVNGIYLLSCRHFSKEQLQEKVITLDMAGGQLSATRSGQAHAGLITLRPTDSSISVAAPFYSIGHNMRAASSHARYAFLEHYAFGELQSLEQASIPNILYAELETSEQSRRTLVERMVSQVGGKLSKQITRSNLGVTARLSVTEGNFNPPVFVEAIEDTQDNAENSAFRRLLRDIHFKRAVAPSLHVNSLLHPQYLLEIIAREQGYSLNFLLPELQHRGGFLASVEMTNARGEISLYQGEGPNKDRATRTAIVAALQALGQSLTEGNEAQNIQSWTTDSEEDVRRHKPTFSNPQPS